MGDRGWACVLLSWGWSGSVLTAEISAARYFVRGDRHEVLAWAELRDLGGRRRIEVGTFGAVAPACAACELDAERRCRREGADVDVTAPERAAVEVRLSPGRRSTSQRRDRAPAPVGPSAGEALDAALRAFADVIEDQD
jgi:hypothetical protein